MENKFEHAWHLLNVLAQEPKKNIVLFILEKSSNKHLLNCLREIAHNLLKEVIPLKPDQLKFINSKKKKIEQLTKKGSRKSVSAFVESNFSLVQTILRLSIPFLQSQRPTKQRPR